MSMFQERSIRDTYTETRYQWGFVKYDLFAQKYKYSFQLLLLK